MGHSRSACAPQGVRDSSTPERALLVQTESMHPQVHPRPASRERALSAMTVVMSTRSIGRHRAA
eukprot:scaffold242588_cov31-Tisochrysis_lutea.AAC.1